MRSITWWLRVRWRQAQVYRQLGRLEEARQIEEELANLLAYGDPDHVIVRKLRSR